MTDIEISNGASYQEIGSIAKKIKIEEMIEPYGKMKAKIDFEKIKATDKGKLILVTSITPTPYGEGKTTVSIGLNDALNQLGYTSIASLRQPSQGPVFGLKGGATGGGYAQVIPMEDINLHFTGDFHAVTEANNLLAAAIDNHIYQGNQLNFDVEKIYFKRCLDVNDRALRNIRLSGRVEHFQITAASEIMSILVLSKNQKDLKKNLGNILLGLSKDNTPIYAKDLKIEGAMAVILKDAIKPNLVQSLENNPVIIHGGPFANISTGTSSLIATNTSLKLARYTITEAGFASDLGAEKFLNIKCQRGGIYPNVIVIVATIKALKHHGGCFDVGREDLSALKKGLSNLEVHLENMGKFTKNLVVTVNEFDTDTKREINLVKEYVIEKNIPFAVCTSYQDGGSGAIDLAKEVIRLANYPTVSKFTYHYNHSITEKIERLAKNIYHASSVTYTKEAREHLEELKNLGLDKLPICVAKTQYSISDDKTLLGYPRGYTLKVTDLVAYTGAGFIVVYLGDILTMPGLPIHPNYEKIDIDNHIIKGIF